MYLRTVFYFLLQAWPNIDTTGTPEALLPGEQRCGLDLHLFKCPDPEMGSWTPNLKPLDLNIENFFVLEYMPDLFVLSRHWPQVPPSRAISSKRNSKQHWIRNVPHRYSLLEVILKEFVLQEKTSFKHEMTNLSETFETIESFNLCCVQTFSLCYM